MEPDHDRRRGAAGRVSRKTIFTAVGGKAVLIKLALDWALVGDDEPVPMADRPEVADLEAQTEPTELVSRWARFNVAIGMRAGPLADVLAVAADVDPEAAQVHATSERNRLRRGRGIDPPAARHRRVAARSHGRGRRADRACAS